MSAALAAKRWIQTFKEVRERRGFYHLIKDYRCFVPIRLETDAFVIRTVDNGFDLLKALQLRHAVFVEEWQGRKAHHGLDVDTYDLNADHLVIEEKSSAQIVGTYRLLSSHFTHDFYSSSEFDLREFLRRPAVKLEMGRACIHPRHRSGQAIDLLWRGLGAYIEATKTEFLFGCSSVRSTDPVLMSRLVRSLIGSEQWSDDYRIRPTPDYAFPGFRVEGARPLEAAERRELFPALLRSYLSAGAKVHGYPALDRDFACIDLLTILDWKQLDRRFHSRFILRR